MIRSPLQEILLVSLAAVLRPVAKIMLQSGLGSAEFMAVAKSVFVHVATEEFGVRGRPTNVSRVSAMTGISRKEVSRIKADGPVSPRWTPDLEANPANTVIHHWHYDPEFSISPGKPKPLSFDGPASFTTLVNRYAGDIPPGAIRAELKRAGTIEEQEGPIVVRQRYYVSAQFDEDLVRRMMFALANLGATIAHNASVYQRASLPDEVRITLGRFERSAWTDRLSNVSASLFRQWVRQEGARFIEDMDHWMGEHELPKSAWKAHTPRTVGVGVYYFEENE